MAGSSNGPGAFPKTLSVIVVLSGHGGELRPRQLR